MVRSLSGSTTAGEELAKKSSQVLTSSKPAALSIPRGGRFGLYRAELSNVRGLVGNLPEGISLTAMNIPQPMGYGKIAGTPVYYGALHLVAASDSATSGQIPGGAWQDWLRALAAHTTSRWG
jgi:hypothetical protein